MVLAWTLVVIPVGHAQLPTLTKLPYNHVERLEVDLQVGLWAQPLPMDWDGDGDLDMVAVTAGVPSNGVWVYENPAAGGVSGGGSGTIVRVDTRAIQRAGDGGATAAPPISTNADVLSLPARAARDVVFKPGKWVAKGPEDITVSYVNGQPLVCVPGEAKVRAAGEATPFGGAVAGGAPVKECSGVVYPDFRKTGFDNPQPIGIAQLRSYKRTRGDQWKFFDYNGDGAMDVVVGLGVWDDYGWDDAYNPAGVWTNGPLHGYVMVALNTGTTESPKYDGGWLSIETWQPNPDASKPEKWINPETLDVYGASSPNFADFDADGDLDLVCGEFLDALTYFENVGTRTEPRYARGKFLARDGRAIRMDLQMLQVIALDWDGDGDTDLVVGQEDGRIALWEHTGKVENGMPVFELPVFFKQEADYLRIGVLPTPTGADWDGDGDQDLIAGDTAGYINFVENIGYFEGKPIWAPPVYLNAGGERIRIQAGTNGGIQGPCEAKWGYTTTTVGDWDMDGDLDIVTNSIWGEILLYENVGTMTAPELAAAQPIEVEWDGPTPKPAWFWWNPKGKQLVTQWRTSPFIGDMNSDEINDLVILDHEGYLALFERSKRSEQYEDIENQRRVSITRLITTPGARVFLDEKGEPLRLNSGWAGKSGRRKFTFCDWDGDGKTDMMLDGKNVEFWKNVAAKPGEYRFKNMGPVAEDKLAGHTIAPGLVDWNKDGVPDLIAAAEDGCVYYLENPRTKGK